MLCVCSPIQPTNGRVTVGAVGFVYQRVTCWLFPFGSICRMLCSLSGEVFSQCWPDQELAMLLWEKETGSKSPRAPGSSVKSGAGFLLTALRIRAPPLRLIWSCLRSRYLCFLVYQSECIHLFIPAAVPAVPLCTGLAGNLEECFSSQELVLQFTRACGEHHWQGAGGTVSVTQLVWPPPAFTCLQRTGMLAGT